MYAVGELFTERATPTLLYARDSPRLDRLDERYNSVLD